MGGEGRRREGGGSALLLLFGVGVSEKSELRWSWE